MPARNARPPKTTPELLPSDLDLAAAFPQFIESDERGALVIAPDRMVIGINEPARKLLGFSGPLPSEVTGVVADLDFAFGVGEALHDRRTILYESYLPEPDRILRYQIIPISDDFARPEHVVATVEDVTRLRHLETVRRDFVANVSHELRTPIASINLLVETLERGALEDPAAAKHFLGRIEVETQAMARLVQDLLELSRLETGVLSLNPEVIDLASTAKDVLNRLAPMADEKHTELQLDLQTDLAPVRADSRRLEQVLVNLVHNAIKFTPRGGQVTVRALRQGRGVRIEVVDTGVGMDPADAQRVFERFYKVDPGRNREEGAGLGLAIARHLVELHGSRLQVISEPGRGSRFSFSLPVSDDAA